MLAARRTPTQLPGHCELQFIDVLSSDDVVAASDDGKIELWMTALNEQFVKTEKAPEVVDLSTYWLGEEYKNA